MTEGAIEFFDDQGHFLLNYKYSIASSWFLYRNIRRINSYFRVPKKLSIVFAGFLSLNIDSVVAIIIFFVLHWYLSLFSQTFFQHRYAAHKAFTMSKFWERFFFVFSYVTQGSSYLSPKAYGIMHRMHHAFTDTEHDPHSPSYDKNLFAMMWRTKNVYTGILDKTIPVEDRFSKNVPEWKWFDTMANHWISRLLWGGLYIWFYVAFAPSAWWYILLPLHMVMGPLHGMIINWFAHKYGEVNFETDNTSRNLFKLDLLMFGEGYHNNHHKFPSRTNFAAKKGELDLCYPIITLLDKIGVIKTVHPKTIEMAHAAPVKRVPEALANH